ncbi:MAG: hypothetical protein B7Y26_04580 [Hydrogenophilales bacterium 16-64-46]|nr:MAG: hypothetical protein B7Z32_04610 [Hydrogenophilales bacterium 12-64-13]OYZ06250.1 MAG: hypothetical protein B7Y26_04580 [Hydrogenophilales bacterium 16-64-46]OZA38851.1 MAG: hypothetical protein B7X87_05310 [Hydrogenophilales bacterium 17-64-34]
MRCGGTAFDQAVDFSFEEGDGTMGVGLAGVRVGQHVAIRVVQPLCDAGGNVFERIKVLLQRDGGIHWIRALSPSGRASEFGPQPFGKAGERVAEGDESRRQGEVGHAASLYRLPDQNLIG